MASIQEIILEEGNGKVVESIKSITVPRETSLKPDCPLNRTPIEFRRSSIQRPIVHRLPFIFPFTKCAHKQIVFNKQNSRVLLRRASFFTKRKRPPSCALVSRSTFRLWNPESVMYRWSIIRGLNLRRAVTALRGRSSRSHKLEWFLKFGYRMCPWISYIRFVRVFESRS